ncbi:glutamate--tRNA ligase [Patescibacteria group bacterium]|nr:glutamate--tRNA ligase [Patescibacteria group bacterium]
MENLNLTNVRVRIAPSPTGFVHIGNLRTILYNYLFAKHYKGKFIIRIEDTDQSRFVPGALENLLGVLQWAGFENDEGPFITPENTLGEKGEFGPYIQSARLKIYHDYIQQLLDKNKAYCCFCPKERLEKLRADQVANKKAPKYDNFCRNLSREEVQSMLAGGTPHVIRFKMPENKEIIVKDIIRGNIIVNSKDLDDYVLMKADGFPTYHFASIVDDHLMKITHVMRGEEWIASAPKHVLLYEAFNWQPPLFAHLPQLLSKSKKKLSKRDGDASVQDFIEKGYLKKALLNFIALLGWNSGTEQEIYSMDEMIKQFTLDNVHKAGAVFDIDKLDWINGVYIRELSIDEFYNECLPYLVNSDLLSISGEKLVINETGERVKPGFVKDILSLEQTRIKRLNEIPEAIGYFFRHELDYQPEALIWKKSDREQTIENLQNLIKLLKKIKLHEFTKENLEKLIFEFLENKSIDTGSMLWPMRFALSGQAKSPGPFEIADALGRKKTIERIESAIAKLQNQ